MVQIIPQDFMWGKRWTKGKHKWRFELLWIFVVPEFSFLMQKEPALRLLGLAHVYFIILLYYSLLCLSWSPDSNITVCATFGSLCDLAAVGHSGPSIYLAPGDANGFPVVVSCIWDVQLLNTCLCSLGPSYLGFNNETS